MLVLSAAISRALNYDTLLSVLAKFSEISQKTLPSSLAHTTSATQRARLLKQKTSPISTCEQRWGSAHNSLTMTYFHTGICTIIGAKSFHCPVRDGKEWDQLAMVVRHNGLPSCSREQRSEFIESSSATHFDCRLGASTATGWIRHTHS